MTEQEYYQKRSELLSNFKDGGKRFMQDHLFNKIIQSIIQGADEFKLIESLLKIIDEQDKTIRNLIDSKTGSCTIETNNEEQ